ncbi:transcriptional regulator [Lactobacillus helveticus]|nr:transcriptional regulator [Lactobacillus helveticus]
MKDVAREAHVSVGTVSNYLNGKTVKKDSATKIEHAIKKLRYIRNDNARLLKTQRSPFVVFVTPNVWSPYFSELTYWIQKYLNKSGFKLVLCISENDYQKEKGYVTMAEEQRVAGIISVSYSDLTSHVLSNIPLVSIEKESTGNFSLVTSDNYHGGEIAAEEFKKRGIHNCIFIGSTDKKSVSMVARKSGFVDFCNNNGLAVTTFDFPPLENKELLSQITETVIEYIKQSPDKGNLGIFTHTEEVQLYILKALQKSGLKVPEDVQIIGFDGWKLTPRETISFSAIRQPIEEIAKESVAQLIQQIMHPDKIKVSRINLPVKFIAGDTTKNEVNNV